MGANGAGSVCSANLRGGLCSAVSLPADMMVMMMMMTKCRHTSVARSIMYLSPNDDSIIHKLNE